MWIHAETEQHAQCENEFFMNPDAVDKNESYAHLCAYSAAWVRAGLWLMEVKMKRCQK